MNSVEKWGTRSAAMIVLSALVLTACSSAPKTAGTTSTYETDENGQRVKTTVIREVEPNLNPPPPIAGTPGNVPTTTKFGVDSEGSDTDGDNIEVQSDPKVSGYADDSRVHVRAPLVKVDADDDTGSVHIKAPFVTINKNGRGDRTTIRIPGITIRGNE